MIRKSLVCKLTLDIQFELPYDEILASSGSGIPDIQVAVNGLNAELMKIVEDLGFRPVSAIPRYISKLHDGYALYTTYVLKEDYVNLKLLIDLRAADHASKPDLPTKTAHRATKFFKEFPEYAGEPNFLRIVDTYCKLHGEDVQIYVGKSSDYSTPVHSFEKAGQIVEFQIKRVIKQQFLPVIAQMLDQYNTSAIELAVDYLNETSNLTMVDLTNGTWAPVTETKISDYRNSTYKSYLSLALAEDLVTDSQEFDRICKLIAIKDKYDNI